MGNWWYALCAVSPAAGAYYWKNAERTEEFRVKMVTSDDEQTTDITVEGAPPHRAAHVFRCGGRAGGGGEERAAGIAIEVRSAILCPCDTLWQYGAV